MGDKNKVSGVKLFYLVTVLINIIPLFGIFILKWNLKEFIFFYIIESFIYEIFMIPKFWIFAFITKDYYGKPFYSKFFNFLLTLIFHVSLFFLSLTILFQAAFHNEKILLNEAMSELFNYLYKNIHFAVLLAGDYFYGFYLDYFKNKEHKKLTEEHYEVVFYVYYIIYIVILAVTCGISAGLQLYGSRYRFVFLILIIIIKTLNQIFTRKRKINELNKIV